MLSEEILQTTGRHVKQGTKKSLSLLSNII